MKLDVLLTGVAQIFGPEAVAEYASAGSYILRRSAALGIDVEGLVRSEQDVQANRQQQQQQQMIHKLGPTAIGAAAKQQEATQPTQ